MFKISYAVFHHRTLWWTLTCFWWYKLPLCIRNNIIKCYIVVAVSVKKQNLFGNWCSDVDDTKERDLKWYYSHAHKCNTIPDDDGPSLTFTR